MDRARESEVRPAGRPTRRLLGRWGACGGLLLLLVTGCASPRPREVEVAVWGSSSAAALVEGGDLQATLGVPVYDGGVPGEVSSVIAARQGGAPAVLTVRGDVIPTTGSVQVDTTTFGAVNGLELPGTLAGVMGTLRRTEHGWEFERRSAGPEVRVAGPEPLVSDASVAHAADVELLWMGKNDVDALQWRTAADKTKAAFDYAQAHSGRVLVLGHFANRDMTPGSAQRDAFDQLQRRYVADYGTRFVDVEAYVCSAQIWTDTGRAPTSADLRAQQEGTLPPSLGDAAGQHLATAVYRAVGERLLKPRLAALGWLD